MTTVFFNAAGLSHGELRVWVSLVTHVDDGVRLDVVHVRVPEAQFLAPPLGGADDAGGDGVLQGERAADGHHELSRTKIIGPTQQQDRQLHLLQQTMERGTIMTMRVKAG